jgi:hypothetical protein
MTALAGALAIGGTQLASAALTVLTDVATGIGALVMLCTVLFGALCLIATRGQREPLAVVVPDEEVGDDTIAMVGHDVDAEIEQWLREGGR